MAVMGNECGSDGKNNRPGETGMAVKSNEYQKQ